MTTEAIVARGRGWGHGGHGPTPAGPTPGGRASGNRAPDRQAPDRQAQDWQAQAVGQPWSLRLAGVSQGSPALELYEQDSLVDVVTATRLAPLVLRGARLSADDRGRARVIAWGRLPAAGDLTVSFSRGRLRRRAMAAEVTAVASWCWLAIADGRYRRVRVSAGGRVEQRRLRRGRAWR